MVKLKTIFNSLGLVLLFFVLLFVSYKNVIAACGSQCGWTGYPQCGGTMQCKSYETLDCYWANGKCSCLNTIGCSAGNVCAGDSSCSSLGTVWNPDAPAGCCSVAPPPPPPPPPPSPKCDGWADPNSCHQNTNDGCYYQCNSSGSSWNGPYGPGCTGSCSGGGTPPVPPSYTISGYHDGFGFNTNDVRTTYENQIYQNQNNCRAAGWATDNTDTSIDVDVRVLSDSNSTPVATGKASGLRDDLGGVCSGGTCAFDLVLPISTGVNHNITVEAKDNDTSVWVPLNNTPRTLHCCTPMPSNSGPTNLQPSGTLACTSTTTNITWDAFSGASRYALRINDESTPWANDCNLPQYGGDVCLDNVTSTSYLNYPVIAGRKYHVWVHALNPCGDWSGATHSYFSRLSMSVTPSSVSIAHPGTQNLDPVIQPSGTTVGRVDFSSSNTGVVTVSPNPSPPTYPYRATAISQAVGTATITASAYDSASGGNLLCSVPVNATVTSTAVTWWQVRGGDVVVKGNLSSLIPPTCTGGCTNKFNLKRDSSATTGNVNIYNGSADFEVGSGFGTGAEPVDYKVDTSFTPTAFTYNDFANLVPSSITPFQINMTANTTFAVTDLKQTYFDEVQPGNPHCANGYCYVKVTSNSDLNRLTLTGNRTNMSDKVIVLVERGYVWLGGAAGDGLTLNRGVGFFMVVANSGRIFVHPLVQSSTATDFRYEGLFFSNWEFRTSTNPLSQHNRLVLRGSFVGLNNSGQPGLQGIELRRLLADNSATPAELFEYAPELMMLYPQDLMEKKTFWQEVSP